MTHHYKATPSPTRGEGRYNQAVHAPPLTRTSGGLGLGPMKRGHYYIGVVSDGDVLCQPKLKDLALVYHQGLMLDHPRYRLMVQKAIHWTMSKYWRYMR